MKIQYTQTKRHWLKAYGADTVRFLSGMWTADIKRAEEKGLASTGRSYLLNSKGKAVVEAQFWVLGKNEILFSIPFGYLQNTVESLERLLVADDVVLETVEDLQDVLEFPNFPKELILKLGVIEKFDWHIPDAKDCVYRGLETDSLRIVPKMQISDSHYEIWPKKKFQREQILRDLNIEAELVNDLVSMRIDAGVPLWGVDINPDDLVLEYPHKDAISFHKGCYIGQEVVARATYRGKMTKGLVKIVFDQGAELGFIYNALNLDQPIGKITSVYQNKGLGLVRLNAVENCEVVQKSGAKAVNIHIVGG